MGASNRIPHRLRVGPPQRSAPGLAVVVFASVVLAPLPSIAQQEPLEARYAQGVTLREQHRDAEALALFSSLHTETRAPRALAQMALAEAALGRWVEAEAHLGDALGSAADPWVQRNRAALDGTLRTVRGHLGSLEVITPIAGAEVWIQGRRVAALPMTQPARVIAGTVAFEVRAPGHLTMTRVATVTPDGLARESVELAATPAPGAPSSSTAPAPPESATPEVTRPRSTQRTLGWVAAASAGAFLVGGAVVYGIGLGQVSEYDNACPPPNAPDLSADCASRVSSVAMMEALAITGFVGGGVLAAASAALLLTAPSSRAARTGLACGQGPGEVGVSCRIAF
jgi:hypothetical protein